MSTQLVVRVPKSLAKSLDDVARREARKRSEVVRLAIEGYVRAATGQDPKAARQRAMKYVGSLRSGIPDLAERHSEYVREMLIEKLRRAR